jgi:hypothetical protein
MNMLGAPKYTVNNNLDHMRREAKNLRKVLIALFEDARTRVAELETQV